MKIARKDFYYAYNMLYCTPFVQPFLSFTRIYLAKFITLHTIVSRYISASSFERAYSTTLPHGPTFYALTTLNKIYLNSQKNHSHITIICD